ncbi:MAG: hypothetical protein HZA81_03680 [Candidatus Taylorbacteria bacterium]|nr:hypothetical protein [Candidatus Taylorbacteria bacterium]
MKKLPWNRFTKHSCVLFVLAVIAFAYFWDRTVLLAIPILLIPLVHRIEKDYRSLRRQCPQCRRWKCEHEFDRTLCTRCVEGNSEAQARKRELLARPRTPQGSPYPGLGRMPERPRIDAPFIPAK